MRIGAIRISPMKEVDMSRHRYGLERPFSPLTREGPLVRSQYRPPLPLQVLPERKNPRRLPSPRAFSLLLALQRPQEVQDVLLAAFAQVVEVRDYAIRFGTVARMFANGALQVRSPSVVQKEHPLPEAPQWGGAELPRTRLALADSVRQPVTHVVDQQVGEEIHRLVVQRRDGGVTRRERGCVAQRASDFAELLPAVRDGGRSSRRIGRRLRRI